MAVLSNTGIRAGASAAGGGSKTYVDDVFSIDLYHGTDSSITFNNGIDLENEGGAVWFARRSYDQWRMFTDTVRGTEKAMYTDQSGSANTTVTGAVTSYNDDGFTIGTYAHINGSANKEHVAWTFREAPGFFDIVQFTGTGANQTIAHNLGCVPGMIITKKLNGDSWHVYHVGVGNTKYARLETNEEFDFRSTAWNNTTPTATHFTVGSDSGINGNGDTIMAYLFAAGTDSDSQIFGEDGDESIIKCGYYTGNGSGTGPVIDLGWEAQWTMIKAMEQDRDWIISDDQRGTPFSSSTHFRNGATLTANTADNEWAADTPVITRATGFQVRSNSGTTNDSGYNYAYVAIRRPMKKPTDATKVFHPTLGLNASANGRAHPAPFPADLSIFGTWYIVDKRRSRSDTDSTTTEYISTENTSAEASLTTHSNHIGRDGIYTSTAYDYSGWYSHHFKRSPGFFDIVAYTGTGTAGTVKHNLEAVPGIIIVKNRASGSWYCQVYDLGKDTWLEIDSAGSGPAGNGALFNSTLPTASVFSVSDMTGNNGSGTDYIAYLWGSVAGVSKISTYSGTGSAINVDCGFTGGARYVLIKRGDAGGDWQMFTTAQGIVSGNDGLLRYNSGTGLLTNNDYIDPLSSGFTVTDNSMVNTNGGTYVYMAIA